jgi:hypothetical protein
LLHRLLAHFRPDPLRVRVEAAVQRGSGLHRGEWLRVALPLDERALHEVADEIVGWCRDRMASSRRPYGIDQMALAIACAEPGGVPVASKTFGVFRPLDFYREDGVAERVSEFVRAVDLERVNAMRGGVRFAAALFSWGDVARDAIFTDSDQGGGAAPTF